MPLHLISWNICQRDRPWYELAAAPELDVALLQEAKPPPADVNCEVFPPRDADAWTMPGYKKPFRTAVARFSDRVSVRDLPTTDLPSSTAKVLGVSYPGTLAVAEVEHGGESLTCISVYCPWQHTISDTTRPWIIADASAHRLISDISALIATQHGHRIIVAGDFNLLRGYGEGGSAYWANRYATVFDRMRALGLHCVGPEAPNGRQAEPWPQELPKDSKNVPTFHSSRQTPTSAARQLDYVFASDSVARRVRVRAMNEPEHWGPSDHCRIAIEIADP